MELLKAQTLCLQLMDKHGLTKEAGWKFEWINSQRAAGKCRTHGGRKVIGRTYGGKRVFAPTGTTNGGVIMLSKFITQHHDEAKVLDTILHEIAHGLTPGHGHDYVWRSKALSIGCNGERCFDVNDSETLKEAKKAASKYTGKCPLCPNEWHTNRLPKRDQWCKCTKRRFKQEEKIVYTLNGTKSASIAKPTPKVPIEVSRSFNQFIAQKTTSEYYSRIILDKDFDSYHSMLCKFRKEFLPLIGNDVTLFMNITRTAETSNSWRTMNREVRKTCNQYMIDNNKMSNKQFQEMFFYESVMIGRITWGKNAPWIGGKPS